MATPSFITRVKLNNKEYELRGLFYAVCGTAAATQTKAITVDGITSLYDGLNVRIKFTYDQTYNGQPKLKINSLDAVGIVYQGTSAAVRYQWYAGEVLDLVYDGTNFVILNEGRATTSYWGMTKLSSAISTDNTTAATPGAVKAAYDLASQAYNAAADTVYAMTFKGTLGSEEDDVAEDLPDLELSTPSPGDLYFINEAGTYNFGHNVYVSLSYGDMVVCNWDDVLNSNPYWVKIPSSGSSKAPKDHASTDTTYGKGTGSNYGHVKLSDDVNSTSSSSAGIAATPSAVKSAYDLASTANSVATSASTAAAAAASLASDAYSLASTANTTANAAAPKSHASTATTYGAGNSTKYGHVKLSDAINSTSSAANGVAATPSAVKSAYDLASSAMVSASSAIELGIAAFSYIDEQIASLPQPMIFKGSIGVGGTLEWSAIPEASATNEGWTYKVISDCDLMALDDSSISGIIGAKIGDTIISNGSEWILIPSGDEPSGTVTSVKIQATSPIAIDNSAAITTTGTRTISHANSGVSAGTYAKVTVNATGHVTSGATLAATDIPAHTSTATTYGAGTSTAYGHLKLSNSYNSSAVIASGYAATPAAAYSAALVVSQAAITSASSGMNRILLGSTDDTAKIESVYKDADLVFTPSTSTLQTVNTSLTGSLTVTGNAYLNNNTIADNLSAGSLMVTVDAAFVNIPTAPTASAGTSTMQLATTEFVQNAVANVSITPSTGTAVSSITFSAGSLPTLGTAIAADDITSWNAGSLPTLGTAIPADDITSWSAGTLPSLGTAISADDITSWSAGSLPTLGTAIPADDITSWSAGTATIASVSGGVLTITSGTAPALSYTAKSIPNVTGVGSLPSLSYTSRSIPNVTSVGTLPSLSYTAKSIPNVTGVGSLPSLSYSAKSIPNVTGVGSLPSLSYSTTTVVTSI